MKPRGMDGDDLDCAVTINVDADIAVQEDMPEAADESARAVASNGSGEDITPTMHAKGTRELPVEAARAHVDQLPPWRRWCGSPCGGCGNETWLAVRRDELGEARRLT